MKPTRSLSRPWACSGVRVSAEVLQLPARPSAPKGVPRAAARAAALSLVILPLLGCVDPEELGGGDDLTIADGSDDEADEAPTEDGSIEDAGTPGDCDVLAQDCPLDQKCVAYGTAGEVWDANRCVPVHGDQTIGQACSWAGFATATDDCDSRSACWNLVLVAGNWGGTCRAFCSPDLACKDGFTCVIEHEGVAASCQPIDDSEGSNS